MAETKLIQLNLMEGTLQRLGRLEEMLGARNRTEAVVRAVEIAYPIVEAIIDGKDVVLETRDGFRERFVIPGVGRVVTYYAVIHGGDGTHSFRPMRTAPGFSQLAFEYQRPEFPNDNDLKADFDRIFLPLSVDKIDADGRKTHCGDFKGDYALVEAEMLAGNLVSHGSPGWVLICTRDGRVLTILPNRKRQAPMPFVVADDWCQRGAMICRLSWGTTRFLVRKHASIPDAYVSRRHDGTMETWTPSDEDKAATDWSGLGPQ
jgi:hypothetical protein